MKRRSPPASPETPLAPLPAGGVVAAIARAPEQAPRLLCRNGDPVRYISRFPFVAGSRPGDVRGGPGQSWGILSGECKEFSPRLVRWTLPRHHRWPAVIFGPALLAVYTLVGRRPRPLQLVAVVLVVAAVASGFDVREGPSGLRVAPWLLVVGREPAYSSIVAYLRPRVGHTTLIGALEIGTLGYLLDTPMLDPTGLVSPEVVRPVVGSNPAGYGIPVEAIQRAMPAYLVTPEIFVGDDLRQAQWFRDGYRRVTDGPADEWAKKGIVVYKRVD